MGKNKSPEAGGRKKRSPNFTDAEVRFLMKLAFAHIDVIESKKTDSETWRIKDTVWNSITQNFNDHPGTMMRTVETVRQKYEGIKKLARKKAAKNKEEEARTDGEPDFIELEDYEKELIQILETTANGMSPTYESDAFADVKVEASHNARESDTTNEDDKFHVTDDDMIWDLPESFSRPRLQFLKKQLEYMEREEERRVKEHKFRLKNLQIEKRMLMNKERRTKAEHQKKLELLDFEISLKKQKLENNMTWPTS
ncbi:uncharacterized protein LOC132707015 isoform X2 [Cylas formicarius]|uniref:uncharacterized protein LOC132707015 isoform X2 n=1 Tax=Cylas formicarius TaxID=197179 RepID=UPI002958B1E8|nr:uncharacterized protein LOC132707015 isoform X2 [Cylas formicarius]